MDNSNKTGNYDRHKKENKMVVKFGSGGGGGGIGAVIVLGGVLATAALASAFVARRKGRSSSGKDRRSFHRNPPPENDKLSEQDEGDNDTLSLDVKVGGVSDDGFVIVDEDFPHSDDKLPLESQNKISEDEQREGDFSDDGSKEEESQEQVRYIEMIELDKDVDEEREIGVEERENGLKENMEVVKLDREDVEGFCSGEAELMSEKKSLESVVSDDGNEGRESGYEERENELKEDMEVKLEGFCSVEDELMSEKKFLQSVVEDEIVLEDEETWNEEKLVEKQEKCEEKQRNETRDKVEEREENETTPHEKSKEENGYIPHQTPNGMIANEEPEFDAKKNVEKEVDVSPVATNEGIDNAKSDTNSNTNSETSEDEEEEKEEIVEESSLESGDSSSESNSEAVWPTESEKPKLVDNEVGERDDQINNEEKASIDKYYMGEMEMKNDRRINSVKRRVATTTLLLLSSLSCSWFFGLSSVNLCLVVVLTMLLSEIHGY